MRNKIILRIGNTKLCYFPQTRVRADGGYGDYGWLQLIEKSVIVKNVNGLDMKTAARVAEAASQFSADIFLLQGRMKVNAKSIMGVIMLAARPSSELLLIVDGEDEAIVLKQFEKTLNTVFDEANLTPN